MGKCFGKPRESNSLVRDSIVLCDGYYKMTGSNYTSSIDGRFVFILGNMQSTRIGVNRSSGIVVSFQLDIVDLFLSSRIRIDNVGDFYDYGVLVGFYALSDRSIVIVDYQPRLVNVDIEKGIVVFLHRCYSINFESFLKGHTTHGVDWASTMVPSTPTSPTQCIVYPSDPLSTRPHKEITDLIATAKAHVQLHLPHSRPVSNTYPPFFISPTVCRTSSFYVQEATRSDIFYKPRGSIGTRQSEWIHSGDREMCFISRFRRSSLCWQVLLATFCNRIVTEAVKVSEWLHSMNHQKWSLHCLVLALRPILLQSRLLEPENESFIKLGVLDTRTLQWSQITAPMWNDEGTSLVPLRNGQFIIVSNTSSLSGSRLIGHSSLTHPSMHRIRIVDNPRRLSSLLRISSIEVQKNGRIDRNLQKIIAERIR